MNVSKEKQKEDLSVVVNHHFDAQKKATLTTADLSRKGSVDADIVDLINLVNSASDLYTTSSCSGRVTLFSFDESTETPGKKRGCQWHLVSHSPVDWTELKAKLDVIETNDLVTLKFEPFILHIQCRNLSVAKCYHQLVLDCGHRNSGLTIGNGNRVNLAVRSNLCLEVPLMRGDDYKANEDCLRVLAELVGEKFQLNTNAHSTLLARLKEKLNDTAD